MHATSLSALAYVGSLNATLVHVHHLITHYSRSLTIRDRSVKMSMRQKTKEILKSLELERKLYIVANSL